MPKGSKGQKRPADVIGNAVKVMKIGTGEDSDASEDDGKDSGAKAMGKRGGEARAKKLTANQRREIERTAAKMRWEKANNVN